MAEVKSYYEIELKVLGQGTVTAKVKDLTNAFELLSDATKAINEDIRENGTALVGTTKYYNQEIEKVTRLRDGVANTSVEYRKYSAAITELTKKKEALRAPLDGTLAAFNKELEALRQEQRQLAKNPADWAKYEQRIGSVKKNIDKLTNSQVLNTRSNKGMISNAGLAGATLTEVGRTVSDANYGIRGMANNLSQLSTLFITLVSKTGTFKSALGAVLKQINGPLGYILVFQAVITLLEAFSSKQDEAKRKSKELEEQLINTTNAIKDQNKALEKNVDESKKREFTIKAAILSAREFMEVFNEGMAQFDEDGILQAETALLNISQILGEAGLKDAKLITDQNIGLEQRHLIANELLKQATLQTQIDEYQAILFQSRIDLEQKRFDLTQANGVKERATIQQQIDLLEEQVEGSVVGLQRVSGAYDNSVKAVKKLSEQLVLTPAKDGTEKKMQEVAKVAATAFKSSFEEQVKGWKLIEKVFGKEITDEAKNSLKNSAKDALKELEDAFPKKKKDKEEDPIKKAKEDLKQIQDSIDQVETLFDAQFDADISREEAKTTKLNNELKKRLNNENLTAKQREAINAQIAANEAALQKKRDEIAEKQFKMQKAVNIANALVETYRAGWLAFGSQLQIGDPLSPVRAQIAQAVTIAAGLANVAMIAKQQFVPSATATISSGSTGGASAPSIQAPDFNIVGQSGVNQLRDLIQAQSERPVKAYVVSKDISTAQELDRNKVSSASL